MTEGSFIQTLQDFLVPRLTVFEGKLDALQAEFRTEIRRLDDKIDRLNDKIDGVRDDVRNLREEFKLAIDIHERLARLEANQGHSN